MISSNNRVEIDQKALLSTLWIFVLLNIIFRDLHEFFREGMIEEIVSGTPVSEQVMLMGGIMMEIPILMVLLSRILNYRINRWANIIIGAVIIALIIGVGQKDLDDIFFATIETIEVIALSAIIWLAVKWRESKI
ncbi:MAG: hypothetical protein D6756_11485 [Cyanobacteria bacterium J083]|nr:MAG: hypothetical protein D6756_11485 [Cyanobacteria bacterium J083]